MGGGIGFAFWGTKYDAPTETGDPGTNVPRRQID
jgi:hypothetical protein